MHVSLDKFIGVDDFEVGSGEIMKVGFARRGALVPSLGFENDMLGLRGEFIPFALRVCGQAKPLVLGKSWASVVCSIGIVYFPCHVFLKLFPVGQVGCVGQVGINVMRRYLTCCWSQIDVG